ncbi:hypothetical protein [Streptomyces sp. NPDC050485]|uniref:hypothetical protein n=1 Tax=Streptomyces sp. NPDC050485 TaxID=3365617 RepID=UPI003795747A
MAFHINQGDPNPLELEPGMPGSFAIEVFVDGNPVEAGEIIQVKLPEGVFFPRTGEIRYMKLDAGINRPLPIESREPDGRLVRFKAETIENKPEGFYSINVQATPDAALGERSVPDGILIGNTEAELTFRITAPKPVEQVVYGVVGHDGRILSGSGFTVRKEATGTYEITPDNAFVTLPAVTATIYASGPGLSATTDWLFPDKFKIFTTIDKRFHDYSFTFMAMGEAPPQR